MNTKYISPHSEGRRSRKVFGVGTLLLFLLVGVLPAPAHGAVTTLTLSPAAGTVTIGAALSVRVLLNAGQRVNAAEATISFPKDLLEVTSLSTAGSIFTLWAVGPSSSNASGTVTFAGGLPSPGWSRSGGTIITITFRTKATGSAKLTIGRAQVTADDGEGTNVLGGAGSATFTIQVAPPAAPAPPKPEEQPTFPLPTVSSKTHPDENAWYALRDVAAEWSAGSGVKGYSAVFDQSADTFPPAVDEGLTRTLARTGLSDGTWYVHVRAHYDRGWSGVRHFAIHIDATKPEVSVSIDQAEPTSRDVLVHFGAADATSGIARTEIQVNQEDFRIATSPVSLTALPAGTQTITIRATDKAGNVAETSTTFDVVGPQPPIVFFDLPSLDLFGEDERIPALLLGTPIRLRGYARSSDTIRIVVRSTESVFEFPVSDILDDHPVEPAPEGLSAWKVEFSPDLTPGEHTVHVTSINKEGIESREAPVIRFRVVTNVLRIGDRLISYGLIITVLAAIIGLLLVMLALVVFLHIRLRRHVRRLRSAGPPSKKGKRRQST